MTDPSWSMVRGTDSIHVSRDNRILLSGDEKLCEADIKCLGSPIATKNLTELF